MGLGLGKGGHSGQAGKLMLGRDGAALPGAWSELQLTQQLHSSYNCEAFQCGVDPVRTESGDPPGN